ncbi:hypothetical protein Tco_0477866 [Tanacetum coccineum]
MESEKYLEGQSMQRPPLFENDGFIYWKNRFETYVKSKDLDLWHVITDGDFPPIQFNPETKKDKIVSFHKQDDDLKKKLAKNNEAKMNTIRDEEDFSRQHDDDRKTFQRSRNDGYDKSERKCFRCGEIISLENVQSRQRTLIKEYSLEEYGATMEKMRWKRLKMKRGLVAQRPMKCYLFYGLEE